MNTKRQKFCLNCPSKPIHARQLCKNCYEKWLKQFNPEYHQRQLDNKKVYGRTHKDQIATYRKEWQRKRPPEYKYKKFLYDIFKRLGITQSQYEDIVNYSNNTCYICGREPYSDKSRLHLDHNHKTGQIRGLLCARCNWYLATIEKDPTILEKIKNYLQL